MVSPQNFQNLLIIYLALQNFLQKPNTTFQYWDMFHQMTWYILAHMPYFRRPGHIWWPIGYVEPTVPSLQYRRKRGDMIMAYQFLHNNLDLDTSELFTFNPSITRGHKLKLFKPHSFSRVGASFFYHQSYIINNWNNDLKFLLDSSWSTLMYDYWLASYLLIFQSVYSFELNFVGSGFTGLLTLHTTNTLIATNTKTKNIYVEKLSSKLRI